jgi:hypothetical protein
MFQPIDMLLHHLVRAELSLRRLSIKVEPILFGLTLIIVIFSLELLRLDES